MRRLTLLLLLMLPAVTTLPAATGETVILLHGLGRTRWSFWRMEQALRRDGYHVVNLTYPSRKKTIEDLARDHLAPLVAAQAPAGKVHFVTHSLGGILLRCHLRDHRIPNLGRVVMLAPPNDGSALADALKPTWLYRTVNGPAGQQLGTEGLPRALGPWPGGPDTLGIIAGEVSLNPLFSATLTGPNDGKVTVASARLEGMADFLAMPHSHTWLGWRQPVIAQVRVFLRDGKFARSVAPASRFDGLTALSESKGSR